MSRETSRHSTPTDAREPAPDLARDLRALTPDLRTTLASLDGVPADVATAVVSLLPLGSRLNLVACEAAAPVRAGDFTALLLTDRGFRLVRAAAEEAYADPDGVVDWLRRAELAAEASDRSGQSTN